eukprot:3124679-Alexandrium_andersonii.AAC.1
MATQDMSLDLSESLGPTDALVLQLWPEICHDHRWVPAAETGPEQREQFMKTWSFRATFRHKHEKAAGSRWFSILKAMRT